MNRYVRTVFAAVLAATLVFSAGCQAKVEVKTGTRTVCTRGEVISDTTHLVKVPKSEAGKYKVTTVTTTCDRHAAIDALYASAQSDIASGNLVAAQKKLAEVVATESTYRKAKDQLAQITAKKKPVADSTSKTPSTTPTGTTNLPGEQQPTGPVESLLKWAPDSLAGFAPIGKVAADALSITREYNPPAGSSVVSCIVVAEQFRNNGDAKAGLETQCKRPYWSDSATLQVNGRSAYFGTDGRRFAVAGFTQGAQMVAIEMSTKSGKPEALKADLTAALKALP